MAPPSLPYRVISLTPKQQEALLDRICWANYHVLAAALGVTDDPRFDLGFRAVYDQVTVGRIVLRHLCPLGMCILADAMNGSTWCAQVDDGGPPSPQLKGRRRTILALHRKLAKAGLPLQPPVLS